MWSRSSPRLAPAAGRADRGLEVVVEPREIVRVLGRVGLLQVVGGIDAPGVHVEALPCRAVSDLDVGERRDVAAARDRPAVIRGRHPATELARGRRELGIDRAHDDLDPFLAEVAAHARIVPLVREAEVVAEAVVPRRSLPAQNPSA